MNNGLFSVRNSALIIEIMGVMVTNKMGRDIERQEILEFQIAGAIKESRCGIVDGEHAPQAECKDESMCADTARGQQLGNLN